MTCVSSIGAEREAIQKPGDDIGSQLVLPLGDKLQKTQS